MNHFGEIKEIGKCIQWAEQNYFLLHQVTTGAALEIVVVVAVAITITTLLLHFCSYYLNKRWTMEAQGGVSLTGGRAITTEIRK